jgi:hypothetical protein
MTRQGNVIEVILGTARQADADLILMSTDGRNGFLDAVRGSHSERILRHAPCPLLAIPESSFAAALSAKKESDQKSRALLVREEIKA